MTYSYLSALIQTLFIYIIMGIAYFGWGSMMTQVLGLSGDQTKHSAITRIWLGWAVTLLILQFVHIRFALTAYIAAPIFALGIAFSLPSIIHSFRRQLQMRPRWMRFLGILMITLAVTGWIASRSMLTPINYDSGLYHFNAIRWINSFPIVPGLGNLHGRLAFNQSFFTWVAALNFYPLFNHGFAVANSFLFLLTTATLVAALLPILKQPSLLLESHTFPYVSALFAIPILGYLAFFSNGLSSPSPDLASTLLQITLFVLFAQDIAAWTKGDGLNIDRAIILTILSTTAITIKLSNLAFSAAIIGFYLIRIWHAHHLRGALRVMLPALVVILIWVGRGYMLSGAPLYPSTIGYLPVEWAVPKAMVAEEAKWVYSWARQPGSHWSEVLGSWEWLRPWTSLVIKENQVELVYPLVLAVIFFILTVILVSISIKKLQLRWMEFVILVPVVLGLVYWFFTAPDPRFAYALFWCLSISLVITFLNTIRPFLNMRFYIGVLCIVFLVTNLRLMGAVLANLYIIKDISTSGWSSIKDRPLFRKETSSGLTVFIPRRTDQCWDAPLPCTPYFNDNLRLRIPGNLGSGFIVTFPQIAGQESERQPRTADQE